MCIVYVYTKRSRGSGTSWLDIQINKLVSIEVILNSSSYCQLSSREIETERGREYNQIYPQNQFTRYHFEESSIENLPINFSFFPSLLVCVCVWTMNIHLCICAPDKCVNFLINFHSNFGILLNFKQPIRNLEWILYDEQHLEIHFPYIAQVSNDTRNNTRSERQEKK